MRLDAAKYEARANGRSRIDHVCLDFEEVRSGENLDKYVGSFLKVTGEFEITSIQTDFPNVCDHYRADIFTHDFSASGKRYPRVLFFHLLDPDNGARLHHEGIQVLLLGENGADAGLYSRFLDCFQVVRCQQKDRHRGQSLAKNLSRLDAIHYRHRQIKNNEVGLEFVGLHDSVGPIFSFANYEFRTPFESARYRTAYGG